MIAASFPPASPVWRDDEKEAALLLGFCAVCNHSYEPQMRASRSIRKS